MQKQQELPTNLPDPSGFVDALQKKAGVRNDAQLARLLRMQPPQLSKIRHGKLALTGDAIIRIHETTLLSVREIKELAGLPPPSYPMLSDVICSPAERRRRMGSALSV